MGLLWQNCRARSGCWKMKAAVLLALASAVLRVSAFVTSGGSFARQLLYSKNAHNHVETCKLQHLQQQQQQQQRQSGRETIRCITLVTVSTALQHNYSIVQCSRREGNSLDKGGDRRLDLGRHHVSCISHLQ